MLKVEILKTISKFERSQEIQFENLGPCNCGDAGIYSVQLEEEGCGGHSRRRLLDGRAAILPVVTTKRIRRLIGCPAHRSLTAYAALAAYPGATQASGANCILRSVNDLQRAADPFVLRAVSCAGGNMLFTLALVLLAAWLIGVIGVPSAGKLVHVLLLAGLAFLLLAFLRAREAAIRRVAGSQPDKS